MENEKWQFRDWLKFAIYCSLCEEIRANEEMKTFRRFSEVEISKIRPCLDRPDYVGKSVSDNVSMPDGTKGSVMVLSVDCEFGGFAFPPDEVEYHTVEFLAYVWSNGEIYIFYRDTVFDNYRLNEEKGN